MPFGPRGFQAGAWWRKMSDVPGLICFTVLEFNLTFADAASKLRLKEMRRNLSPLAATLNKVLKAN